MSYTYEYPRPALTVDTVLCIFDRVQVQVQVLLIERRDPPFAGSWALPGGFVDMDEEIPAAAARELAEETGVEGVELRELGAFGKLGRDPRGRTVSVVFLALTRREAVRVEAGDDAAAARWFDLRFLPPLAFDHDEVLAAARERLRLEFCRSAAAFELLPGPFTLGELRRLYQLVMGRLLEARRFRRRVLATGLLREAGRRGRERLWRLDSRAWRRRRGPAFHLPLGED